MARTRKDRPKMTTKEELIKYLEDNQDKEYPFCQEAWDKAVEKTQGKERQYLEKTETDYDGNTKVKKIPNGSLNPVSKYFQLMALAKYKKLGEELKYQREYEDDEDRELTDEEIIERLDEDDSDEGTFIRELINIYFSNVTGDNLQFVVDRLSDYYTNYEFNEGSDKFLVVSAVSDELSLRELYGKRTRGSDNEAKIDKIKSGYLKTLDGLKLLKKQGSKVDEGKNKFTMFLDTLDKDGELKMKGVEYPDDQISHLVRAFRDTVTSVFKDGV